VPTTRKEGTLTYIVRSSLGDAPVDIFVKIGGNVGSYRRAGRGGLSRRESIKYTCAMGGKKRKWEGDACQSKDSAEPLRRGRKRIR